MEGSSLPSTKIYFIVIGATGISDDPDSIKTLLSFLRIQAQTRFGLEVSVMFLYKFPLHEVKTQRIPLPSLEE